MVVWLRAILHQYNDTSLCIITLEGKGYIMQNFFVYTDKIRFLYSIETA